MAFRSGFLSGEFGQAFEEDLLEHKVSFEMSVRETS
jgi:hypothetical protein